LNDPYLEKDNGCAYGSDEIHLGRTYTNNYIYMAIFFHELGHAVIVRRHSKKYRKLSIFREESMAWVLAMEFQ
jgi:hypothetical protein